jgi:hypothetical protein
MKTFAALGLDLPQLKQELDELEVYLQSRTALKEREHVLPLYGIQLVKP